MKSHFSERLSMSAYFFAVSLICVFVPSIMQAAHCYYDWQQPQRLFVVTGALSLAFLYGLLTLSSFADLFNLQEKMANIRVFHIPSTTRKKIISGAVIASYPVLAAVLFLVSMFLLWDCYNDSKAYWESYKAIINIEARLLGTPIAQIWCTEPAEIAWYRGEHSTAKKYCELAISLQNKNLASIDNVSQLLRLGDLYWKAGHYENALASFNQAHILLGAKANDRHYASEPSVIDFRPTATMPPVIVEFYDFRDCLDNCMDKLGAAKTYSLFSQFKPWLRNGKCGSIQHGKQFCENGIVILDKETYENLCQTSKSNLKQLALSSAVLSKIYQIPADWIAKLQRES